MQLPCINVLMLRKEKTNQNMCSLRNSLSILTKGLSWPIKLTKVFIKNFKNSNMKYMIEMYLEEYILSLVDNILNLNSLNIIFWTNWIDCQFQFNLCTYFLHFIPSNYTKSSSTSMSSFTALQIHLAKRKNFFHSSPYNSGTYCWFICETHFLSNVLKATAPVLRIERFLLLNCQLRQQ